MIRTVVTRGFGNGTYDGTIALLTLRGYVPGEAVTPPAEESAPELGGGKIVATTRADNRTTATSFTRERWRALRAALDAEHQAKTKVASFKRKKDRKAAEEAVQEIEAALEAAKRNVEDIESAAAIREVTTLIKGATQARAVTTFIARIEEARVALIAAYEGEARRIAAIEAARRAEEEDEDEIALLLMS